MNINTGISSAIEGFYKVSVVDADGKNIIWEDPKWRKNLILNNGMDMIATYPYQQCFQYAIGGTGTRLNSITGDVSVISQSGYIIAIDPLGTLTSFTQSAGGHTTALQVGDVIQYITGSGGTTDVTVTAVAPLSCSVNVSQTVTEPENFIIWKTSQTSLQNEWSRGGGQFGYGPSGSYWVNGSCGSQVVGNVRQLWRTFDFGIESSEKIYTEVGLSPSATKTATNTFSRIVLNSPVTVGINQRLRLAYQLNVSMMPSASVYRKDVTAPIISGWPVSPSTNLNATESLQGTTYLIEGIFADGAGGGSNNGGILDPISTGFYCCAWASTNSRSLAPFGTNYDRGAAGDTYAAAQTSRAAYPGAGSYYCDKVCTFAVGQVNSTLIRTLGLGYSNSIPYIAAYQGYAMLFDQPQTKYNTQTLSLAWRFSWARTLSNGA